MTEHTPTPWSVDPNIFGTVFIVSDGGTVVCEMTRTAQNNARHIVRCVNSHDALVKALEDFTAMYVELVNSGDCGFWNAEEDKHVIAARAALAAAKGEKS